MIKRGEGPFPEVRLGSGREWGKRKNLPESGWRRSSVGKREIPYFPPSKLRRLKAGSKKDRVELPGAVNGTEKHLKGIQTRSRGGRVWGHASFRKNALDHSRKPRSMTGGRKTDQS